MLIHELEGNGYRVPEDVSVVGYDNFVFMPVCDVAITTYGVDMPEMAKAAAERIISRVKGLDKGPGRVSIISGNSRKILKRAVVSKRYSLLFLF